MLHFCTFVAILSSLSGLSMGVNIVKLSVPDVVEAETEPILLDCEYVVDEWERHGLVVKWYVDAVHLVYQWIPPNPPQILGILSGEVNTSYVASSEPWEKYRAIHITHPTPELSGRYSCTVSTFEDEDTKSADLLIWAAAREVELNFWRPSEHLVNITCSVSAAAPEPSFELYYVNSTTSARYDVNIRGERKMNESGLWWSDVWGLVAYERTSRDTLIGCNVILPNTTYNTSHLEHFDPDLPIITTTTTTTLPPTTLNRDQHSSWSNSSGFIEITGFFGSANDGRQIRPCSPVTLIVLLVIAAWRPVTES